MSEERVKNHGVAPGSGECSRPPYSPFDAEGDAGQKLADKLLTALVDVLHQSGVKREIADICAGRGDSAG